MIVFNILFRPSLMVAGFVAGMAIFSAATEIVNNTFASAVSAADTGTTNGWTLGAVMFGGGLEMIARFAMSFCIKVVVLLGLMFIIAERSFSLIHALPDAVARWIGGSAETLGEAQDKEKLIAASISSPASKIRFSPGRRQALANRKNSEGGSIERADVNEGQGE